MPAVLGSRWRRACFKPGSAWAQAAGTRPRSTPRRSHDTVKALGGATATESKDITITSPDIAENGAVVPFTIASKLPKTESIAHPGREEPQHPRGELRHSRRHGAVGEHAREDGADLERASRWSRPTASTTTRPRKSRSPSAAAAADERRETWQIR